MNRFNERYRTVHNVAHCYLTLTNKYANGSEMIKSKSSRTKYTVCSTCRLTFRLQNVETMIPSYFQDFQTSYSHCLVMYELRLIEFDWLTMEVRKTIDTYSVWKNSFHQDSRWWCPLRVNKRLCEKLPLRYLRGIHIFAVRHDSLDSTLLDRSVRKLLFPNTIFKNIGKNYSLEF